MSATQTSETKYFDLHTTGIGYLNRLREVTPRKGKPFMAVTVAALKGATGSTPLTRTLSSRLMWSHRSVHVQAQTI